MKKILVALLLTLVLVGCGDDDGIIYDDNYINNTTDSEISMTDGADVYTVPAHAIITVSLGHNADESIPMLVLITDGCPRIKSSYTYTDWRHKTFIIEPSDYTEFTIVNTGNCTIEISGNYLGEHYGDTITVEKQTQTTARFYNGDSTFTARYVDEFAKNAMPFSNKNGNVITVF